MPCASSIKVSRCRINAENHFCPASGRSFPCSSYNAPRRLFSPAILICWRNLVTGFIRYDGRA